MVAITYAPTFDRNQKSLFKALESSPPGLVSLLERLITGQIRSLLVHSIDRLARGGEPEVAQRWLSKNGFVIREVPETSENQ